MEPDRPQHPPAAGESAATAGALRFQEVAPPRADPTSLTSTAAVAAAGSSPAPPRQSAPAAFATPPRPILLQPGFSRAGSSSGEKGKNRLLELREPDRARAPGRERTNVLPVSFAGSSPAAATDAGGTSRGGVEAARPRPLGGGVTFGGLPPDDGSTAPRDADSTAAASTSNTQQAGPHHPSQSTPGGSSSINYAPLFAEQFSTPLRRRLRASSPTHPGQTTESPLAARVPTPPQGDQDDTDDLYRGPVPPPEQPRRRTFRFDTSGRQLDEDAVSLRSMSTSDSSSTRSSGSSSSRASVVSFVVGAFEAVGRGLGVLSSASSGSSSSSSSSSSSGGGRRWHRRKPRRRSSVSTIRGTDIEAAVGSASRKKAKQQKSKKSRTRQRLRRLKRLRAFSVGSFTTSRRSSTSSGSSSSSSSTSRSRSSSTSSSSDDEPLGRRKVVGTREFRLMLPSGPEEDKPAPNFLSPPTPAALSGLPVALDDRGGTLVTQSLDEIIMSINRLRSAEFHVPTPPPPRAHSEPVPPIATPTPQAFPHVIQVPPTAYDTARPLTPSQILNIAVPAHPPPLELAHTHAQPTAIPSRLLSQTAAGARTPDPSPPGSRASSLRREFLQQLPQVRVDGPTPLPSPASDTPGNDYSPSGSSPREARPKPKDAWWLDVSCPTWEDMRSLGELLQLHPLTLEDILQQDPREKLEVFATLDYYLISFRALDESYFRYTDDGPEGTAADVLGSRVRRKGRGKVEIVEDRPGKEGLEGVGVGGINLYIVVMRDGVVSFHFEDVKKHVSAVTQRVQALEPGFHLSSDWIAHMFMDSMVDVFMPLIDFIEEEADLIDSKIVHHDAHIESPLAKLADAEDAFVEEERRRLSQEEDAREEEAAAAAAAAAAADGSSASSDDYINKQKQAGLEAHELKERGNRAGSASPDAAAAARRSPDNPTDTTTVTTTTLAVWIRSKLRWLRIKKGHLIRLRRLILALYPLIARTLIVLSLHPAQRQARRQRRAAKRGPKIEAHDFDRKAMLKQMVGMRRLVTGLNRLLVPKMEVIGRLRKRAADMRSSARLGEDVGEQMSTYFGDIQDHILSMQQTLAYGEHVLSQSQQAYLSQLNITLASVKNSSQSSILTLSIVTIGVLPLQIVLGLNSVNVTIPKNGDPGADPPPPAPLNLFGIIISVISLIASLFYLLVRQWKRQAKAKYQKKRAIFG